MAEQVAKLKKKQWYHILAPSQFNNVIIGETLAFEPKAMMGKTLSHSLMNLTNDIKRQNINIHFKIVEIDGDKAKTSITGYEIVPYSVKRFVRRNSNKIDMSFTCETADNVLLRLKPLMVTKADVKGSVGAKLRSYAKSYLEKTIKKIKYDEVISDLISHKLQSTAKEYLNKVYPLKICEIRYLGIEPEEKSYEAKAESQEQQQNI